MPNDFEDKAYIVVCSDVYLGHLFTLGPFTEEEALYYAEQWQVFTFDRVAEVKDFYSGDTIKTFE